MPRKAAWLGQSRTRRIFKGQIWKLGKKMELGLGLAEGQPGEGGQVQWGARGSDTAPGWLGRAVGMGPCQGYVNIPSERWCSVNTMSAASLVLSGEPAKVASRQSSAFCSGCLLEPSRPLVLSHLGPAPAIQAEAGLGCGPVGEAYGWAGLRGAGARPCCRAAGAGTKSPGGLTQGPGLWGSPGGRPVVGSSCCRAELCRG